MSALGFSGSYRDDEVTFLLKPLQMEMTDVAEKEALIQSGKKHYSEMLSKEKAPTPLHLDAYKKATELGSARMAKEVVAIAKGTGRADRGASHRAGFIGTCRCAYGGIVT